MDANTAARVVGGGAPCRTDRALAGCRAVRGVRQVSGVGVRAPYSPDATVVGCRTHPDRGDAPRPLHFCPSAGAER